MSQNTREAFEAWAQRNHWSLTRREEWTPERGWTGKSEDGYEDPFVNHAWWAWTASRKAALEEAAAKCDSLCWALDHGGNKYFRAAHAEQCAAAIRAVKE